MNKVIDKAEVKIAISEDLGEKIKQLVQKMDPFGNNKCKRAEEWLNKMQADMGTKPQPMKPKPERSLNIHMKPKTKPKPSF